MARSVPVSVRITQEDAEYISALKIDGATTPSDKIRSIITSARQSSARENTYSTYLNQFQQLLNITNFHELEFELNEHSEFIESLLSWLPTMMAYFILNQPKKDQTDLEALKLLEKDLCNKVFRLIESMMYTSVKTGKVAYNENLFSEMVSEIAQLAVRLNETK
jgi:hypothetical protein